MGSAIVFIAFSAIALLAPFLLVAFLIKLTTIEKPKGHYRNYTLLAICALIAATVIYHLFGQIISGEINFKPRRASVAIVASRENEPVQFALMSALYILFCGMLIASLFKMYREIKRHLAKGPN